MKIFILAHSGGTQFHRVVPRSTILISPVGTWEGEDELRSND